MFFGGHLKMSKLLFSYIFDKLQYLLCFMKFDTYIYNHKTISRILSNNTSILTSNKTENLSKMVILCVR